jgi:hypothetical protein
MTGCLELGKVFFFRSTDAPVWGYDAGYISQPHVPLEPRPHRRYPPGLLLLLTRTSTHGHCSQGAPESPIRIAMAVVSLVHHARYDFPWPRALVYAEWLRFSHISRRDGYVCQNAHSKPYH